MSALKKFLKSKKKASKYNCKNHSNELEEEFEKCKLKWQEATAEESDFLILRSTEDQLTDDLQPHSDLVTIIDRDGLPVLKAIFNMAAFKAENITLDMGEWDQMVVVAQVTDESKECSLIRKTFVRKVDLPEQVDAKRLKCSFSDMGLLTIEMPFHLPRPTPPDPKSPAFVPVSFDAQGRRVITVPVVLGAEFSEEDIHVEVVMGRMVRVRAGYDAVLGRYADEHLTKEIVRTFKLPDNIRGEIESVNMTLLPEGSLQLQVILRAERDFDIQLVVEEVKINRNADGFSDDEETVSVSEASVCEDRKGSLHSSVSAINSNI